MEVGHPMGYYFMVYKTDGIFQNQAEVAAHPSQLFWVQRQPGDLRFVDINGDGLINSSDRTNIGDPILKLQYGFQCTNEL
jgi:hypothetical protein